MIEIVKELGQILKDLPDMALYILVGVLFYKVVIIGSIFGVVKLAIIKLHSAVTMPKVVEKKVTLDDMFITHDGTYEKFKLVLSELIYYNGGEDSNKGKYLHYSDVEYIKTAILEKRRREKANSI